MRFGEGCLTDAQISQQTSMAAFTKTLLCAGWFISTKFNLKTKMKKRILIVVIYLIGCVFGYKYTKFNLQRDRHNKVWTKGDRTFAILISSGSWFTVASMGIIHGLNSIRNDDIAEW